MDEGALDEEGVEVGITVEGVDEGALDEEGVEVGTTVEGKDEGALDEEGVEVGTTVEGVDEGALDEEVAEVGTTYAVLIDLIEFGLPGAISSSLGQLTWLSYIIIQSLSQLHETLPFSIGSLASLMVLNISNNNITGSIPAECYQLTSLTTQELYINSLSGTIPDMFYNLRSITQLDLARNLLTGDVPPSICALVNVSQLSMYNDKLSCYPTCLLNAPNPGNTLPVADPNALIPGGGGATYGSKTGNLTLLIQSQKLLDPVGSNTCAGFNCLS